MTLHNHYKGILVMVFICFCLICNSLVGQTSIVEADNQEVHSTILSCGSEQTQTNLFQKEPDYYREIQKFKKENSLLQKKKIQLKSGDEIHTIPVVVHILHNGDPLGSDRNPTDEQIATEIQQASDRFRHQHAGAEAYTNPNYGVDTKIEFCLATVDESGNFTSGVIRHYTPIHYRNPDPMYVRDTILWDQSKYANMIIANEIFGACGRYRGGSYDYTEYSTGCWWDGLIAHEMGHYFSLDHTFVGCNNDDCAMDNDGVCDTPPKNGAGTNGAPCDDPGNSCDTDDDDTSVNNPYRPVAMGGLGDQPDMLANYMDYTGGCWDSFTEGQKDRMCLFIENNRMSMISNQAIACAALGDIINDIGVFGITIDQDNKCDGSITSSISVMNYGSNTITSFNLNYYLNGELIHTQRETINLPVTEFKVINTSIPFDLPNGLNQLLEVKTSLPNGNTDINIYNDSDYNRVSYITGTECYSSCENFSVMTATGGSTIVSFSESFTSPLDSVFICVTVSGDISGSSETFNVFDEGGNNRLTTAPFQDCSGPGTEICFMSSITDFNTWIADGNLEVTFTPTSEDINPNLCVVNEACVQVFVPIIDLSDCPQNYAGINKLTGTPSTAITFATDGVIESDQTIDAQVDYNSGNYIELLKNFEVKMNKQFRALLEGCN